MPLFGVGGQPDTFVHAQPKGALPPLVPANHSCQLFQHQQPFLNTHGIPL